MDWLKFILMALGVIFVFLLGYTLIGFFFGILSYIFWIGVLATGGYLAYKFLKKGTNLELDGQTSVSQIELDNAKIVKELEDFKSKMNR